MWPVPASAFWKPLPSKDNMLTRLLGIVPVVEAKSHWYELALLKLGICPNTPLDDSVTAEMVNVLAAERLPTMLHKSQCVPAAPVALSISKEYLPPLFQVAAPWWPSRP